MPPANLVGASTKQAHEVCVLDEKVDGMHREMYGLIHQYIEKSPAQLEFYMQVMSISRYLERIADLATNIAEDVIYMFSGEIVRHNVERFVPGPNGQSDDLTQSQTE